MKAVGIELPVQDLDELAQHAVAGIKGGDFVIMIRREGMEQQLNDRAKKLANGENPTGVIPGSHRSGRHPPFESMTDGALACDGESCVPLLGRAGDVALFVSDLWHRRMPTGEGEHGRYFLQVHYARRDIAQRLKPTAEAAQVSPEASARARTKRERSLIGLHEPLFYDG